MEKRFVREIILSNIVAKKSFLKTLNTALFLFQRDFEILKTRENFQPTLAELIELLELEAKSKEELEKLLQELEANNTINNISIVGVDAQRLREIAGDVISVDCCKHRMASLDTRLNELLTAL